MRKIRRPFFLFVFLGLMMLQACSFPGTASEEGTDAEDLAQTMVAQTDAARSAQAPIPTDTIAAEPTLTQTQPPKATPEPTLTLTPTLQKPMVSVSVDTNCRTGPGKIYDYVGALLVGEEAEVIGQAMDGLYWIIKNPDQPGECWLWDNYASVTGATEDLPKYTPPPTPTPAFTWEGAWTTYSGVAPFDIHTMRVTVDGSSFSGYIELGGGDSIVLTGNIADDYLSVNGTWQGPVANGPFNFFALGVNQFQGNGDTSEAFAGQIWAWCGSRSGVSQPSPCFKE